AVLDQAGLAQAQEVGEHYVHRAGVHVAALAGDHAAVLVERQILFVAAGGDELGGKRLRVDQRHDAFQVARVEGHAVAGDRAGRRGLADSERRPAVADAPPARNATAGFVAGRAARGYAGGAVLLIFTVRLGAARFAAARVDAEVVGDRLGEAGLGQ